MDALDVEPGNLLGSSPLVGFKEIDNEIGTVRYALARSGPTTAPTQEGNFATLTFRASANAENGTYAIRVVNVGLADESFNDISGITTSSGSIVVEAEVMEPSQFPSTVIFGMAVAIAAVAGIGVYLKLKRKSSSN